MTAERDTDRRLRTWLADGAEHAPERFVWAALDDIERLPQRPAWRSRLDGLAAWPRRSSSVIRVAGVAAALLAVAVALRVQAPVPGPGGPSRALTSADLQQIVLWEDTMPAGWTLDNLSTNARQVAQSPIRSVPEADLGALPDPAGLVGGRATDFSGPDAIFISWGLVFGRDLDAAVALPSYQAELASADGWGLGPGTPVELGDGGFVFEGQTTRLMGEPGQPVPMRIYLWTHDNALIALGGWFSYDAAVMDALAAGMDARADAIAGGASPGSGTSSDMNIELPAVLRAPSY